MQALDLENLLKTEIPISKEMGVRQFQLTPEGLSMVLPLQENRNHKGTLFGGSLYSAGALACYGLFLMGLRDKAIATNDIVISEGTMKYIAPVNQDARVEAKWNSSSERVQFFEALKIKRKARVLMKAQILIGNKVCAEFSGNFVAKI